MSAINLLRRPDHLFIGGEWVSPSSGSTIDVIDAATEERAFTVAEADSVDITRAVAAAHEAFTRGPWPRLSHRERAAYLRELAVGLRARAADVAQIWPRETGVLHAFAAMSAPGAAQAFDLYADLAATYPFEQVVPAAVAGFGLRVREPVGVVGAIIPWNSPLGLIPFKVAPALLAGCTVVLKLSPEAPGEGYVVAEVAEEIGLPPGVLNVVTADREASETLVRDPRVDKITFTGSTAAGRRIASICGERIARCTLELGGKSAAVILDDTEIATAAGHIAQAETFLSGQYCSSLTRIIVSRHRHDEMTEALADLFTKVRVGNPFDAATQMGPLSTRRQRERVEGYIAQGVAAGGTLAAGGGRPKELDRGWYLEPTVFGNVENNSAIAQEEIFGPVLCVIPADDEEHSIALANDTIYGLNAAVYTDDVGRAREVASRLRTGTVCHNGLRPDFGIGFGGFKQSGIGREGGAEGLLPFLESKTVVLESDPTGSVESVGRDAKAAT